MLESLPARVTVPPKVLHHAVADQMVVLHLPEERFFSLDDVGTRMWSLLVEDGDPRSVLRRLLEIYDVTEEELERDLLAFINRLAESGLVQIEV
jgi:hypothetical protein